MVSVLTQPSNPTQKCVVANGSGTGSQSNVANVAVTCSTTGSFSVGGMVSGLTGSGLALQVNGGTNFTVTGNGPFTFSTSVTSGDKYIVTVSAQPTSRPGNAPQNCTVRNGIGAVAGANVSAVQVSCANISRFAFVAAGGIWAFTINPASGLWTMANGSPYAVATVPNFVTPDPASRFAYVTSLSRYGTMPAVSVFAIDQATGALTLSASGGVVLSAAPIAAGVDPLDKFLCVLTSGALFVYAIDPTTGALTPAAGGVPYPVPVTSVPILTFDPSGTFLYLETSAYRIDPTTGAPTATQVTPFPWFAQCADGYDGCATDPNSNLVYQLSCPGGFDVNGCQSGLVTINTYSSPTSPLTPISSQIFALGLTIQQLLFDASGKFAYEAINTFPTGAMDIGAYTVDATTGALTNVAQVFQSVGFGPTALGN